MRSDYKSTKRDAPKTSNEKKSKAGQLSWSKGTRVGRKRGEGRKAGRKKEGEGRGSDLRNT